MFDKDPNSITIEEAFELVGERAPGFSVRFYEETQLDQIASKREGRPITLPQLCVRIQVNGERDVTCRMAKAEDRRRWPKEFAEFERNKELQRTQMPVQALIPIGKETVTALVTLGCRTVEQLANAPEFTDPKDGDMEIARLAAQEITTILTGAREARELWESQHESNEEIARRAREEWDRQATEEHQKKVRDFQKANHQGTYGPNDAQLSVSGFGNGAGEGGQLNPGANAVRQGQGQGNGWTDNGPRITSFDYTIEQ